MGEQEGNNNQHSSVCIPDLTLILRLEQKHRNLHRFPRLSGRRPRHLASWTGLRHPQETSLPHRGQHLLSTFHRRHARHCQGSGRTWYLTIHNPYHQHLRTITLDSSSRRFHQVDLALKRQRKTFVVDMLTFSSNQPRHRLHRHRRLSRLQ